METKHIKKLNHHNDRKKQLAHYLSTQGTELEQYFWLEIMRNRARINTLIRNSDPDWHKRIMDKAEKAREQDIKGQQNDNTNY